MVIYALLCMVIHGGYHHGYTQLYMGLIKTFKNEKFSQSKEICTMKRNNCTSWLIQCDGCQQWYYMKIRKSVKKWSEHMDKMYTLFIIFYHSLLIVLKY